MTEPRRLSFTPTNISVFPTNSQPTCIVCREAACPSSRAAAAALATDVPSSGVVVASPLAAAAATPADFTFCRRCLAAAHKECTGEDARNCDAGWACAECAAIPPEAADAGPTSDVPLQPPAAPVDSAHPPADATPTGIASMDVTPSHPDSSSTGVVVTDAGEELYEVERILSQRSVEGRKEYRIKWKNFPESDSTWEPEANIAACVEIIEAFRQEQSAKRAARRIANGSGGGSGSSKRSAGGSGADAKSRREFAAATHAATTAPAVTPATVVIDCTAADEWEPAVDVPVVPSSLPALASTTLHAFLEFVQHTFTIDCWDQMPLQSDVANAETGDIAGSNVDFAALYSSLHTCLHESIDVSSLVPVETYQHLLSEVLVPCLDAASRVRILDDATTSVSASDGVLLQKASWSCAIALRLLAMPNVPRPLVREEYFNAAIRFLLAMHRHVVMPIVDQPARDKLMSSTGHASSAAEESAVNWRRLEKQLGFVAQKWSGLLERVTQLIAIEKVPDLLTTQLLDASYALFAATPVVGSIVESSCLHSLQSRAALLVQRMFLLGDAHTRKGILDSIVTAYREMNPTRRHMRTYVVHQGNGLKKEVKKESTATTSVAAVTTATMTLTVGGGEDLSSAIGSSIPLPSSFLATDSASAVSIQLMTALVLHLLQSIATEPLRTDRTRDATSLLDRIKAEVTAKELAAAEETAATASAKKGKQAASSRSKSQKVPDEDHLVASEAAASPFNSSLDTPQVRSDFIEAVTAPVMRVNDYLAFFMRTLIDRIQPPANATSTSTLTLKSSRGLLRNWLEDVLVVLFTPEFPLAESMLTTMTAIMLNIVDGKAAAANERFRLSCVSALALVAIHLKRHSSLAAEKPLVIRPKKHLVAAAENPFGVEESTHAEEAVSGTTEEMHCVCGFRRTWDSPDAMHEATEDGFLIDCDECHCWYHGPCVGVSSQDETPDNWHCENCVIRLECERQTADLTRKREKLYALTAAATTKKAAKKKGRTESGDGDAIAASHAASTLAELESALPPLDASEAAKVGSSVLRQLLINYLDREIVKSADDALLFARQFDLCSWLQQAKVADAEAKKSSPTATSSVVTSASPSFERDLELVQINLEPPTFGSSAVVAPSGSPSMSSATAAWVTREMVMRISRQLSSERATGLLQLYARIVISLCARCKDASPLFRSTAVSAIADLVRVDPVILKEARIKLTLSQRLADSSISTREAVVDLIGTHILQAQAEMNAAAATAAAEPQVKVEAGTNNNNATAAATAATAAAISSKYSLDPDYFRFVLSSLGDSGISVRKKVVRILRDLCLQSRPHPRIIDMCEKLIACVRDTEESMQSLSVTIIYEMWFDRSNPRVRDRAQTKKITKDEPIAYEQDSIISASTPFTPQFQQQVHLIIGVIHRLSGVGSGATSEGVDALTDILLLLLEQESSLSKVATSGVGEMTSLSGLKMNLLKLSREQRKRQQSRATSATGTASALMQSFNNTDKPTKRRTPSISMAEDPTSIRRVCEDMVTVVVDALVNSGQTDSSPTATNTATSSVLPSVTRLSCIQALAVFSQVEPSFLLPHMFTLLPYLSFMAPKPPVDPKAAIAAGKTPAQVQAEAVAVKQAAVTDTSCVLLLLDIFREVLYFIDSPAAGLLSKSLASRLQTLRTDRTFAARLLEDLTTILTKSFQPLLIKASVPTLAILCEKLMRNDMCVKTAKSFVGWLWAHQAGARQLNANSIRALIGVGLLVKHWDLESHYTAINAQAGIIERVSFWQEVHKHCTDTFPAFRSNAELVRKSQWMLEKDPKRQQNIIDPIFHLYKLYLRALSGAPTPGATGPAAAQPKDGGKQQAYVLQGIIAMFSRKPTLITGSKEVIDLCLSPLAPADLQRQALRFLREFLQNEDRRVQRTQREDRVRDKSKRKSSRKKSAAGGESDDEDDEDEDESTHDEQSVHSGASPADAKPKSWVDSTIDASDFLPPMVSMCEKYVYALAVSAQQAVRAEALQFMHVFLHQAVTNPIDAMPSLIAALTDRQAAPQRHAINMVTGLIAHKKEYLRFMEQRFADGIRLSFDMQARLMGKSFDPLHRVNLTRGPADEAVFDRTPMDGIAAAYGLIRKTVSARRQFCKMIAIDLCSVNHIGIFAREAQETQTTEDQAGRGMRVTAEGSPIKPLEPHPSLATRAPSAGSLGAASPLQPATPTGGSQSDEFPAFVPPVVDRAVTPRFAPLALHQSMASPSSFSSVSDGPSSAVVAPRPMDPLAFLAYIGGLVTALPFEDDEPLQLCAHFSKVINTQGASLQAQMQQTIVALKKLNGEEVTENDEEEVAPVEMAQPMETEPTQHTQTAATAPRDKDTLLASLKMQCESAMAITILIQIRQWLQKSYELAGLFDSWNLSALGGSSAAAASSNDVGVSSSRTAALKLSKKFDLPLHFHQLPLGDPAVEDPLSAHAPKVAQAPASPSKVAGRTPVAKSPHKRHQSAPSLPSHATRTSIVPQVCSVQFAHFHDCMERESLFLAMKAPKRGHKRAATMGATPDDESPVKRQRKASTKKKSQKKKRKSFAADSDEEEEEDDDDDAFEEEEPSPSRRSASRTPRTARAKKKSRKLEEVEEGDEEEEEDAYEPNEEDEE